MGKQCKDVSGGLPTFISPWIDGKKAVMVNGGQLTKADVISVEEHEKNGTKFLMVSMKLLMLVPFRMDI